ncbi:MAG: TetR/AcrR family transcriptional regulator [Ruminococcaceae bacterium]|nr:TetR/AcrR family transcriptional regulator [Oscillospiraceae bacterium]
MNVKNNKRKRESIEKIEKAFIGLLQNKELHTITVSDICKIAKLNRSTFYASFCDVYQLADKIRDNLEKDVSNLYSDELQHKYDSNNFLTLFEHIKENQLYYKTYFKLGYDNSCKITLWDNVQAEKYFGNKNINYHLEFFRNGFNAVVKMWLEGGCKESAQEISEIIKSEYQGRV